MLRACVRACEAEALPERASMFPGRQEVCVGRPRTHSEEETRTEGGGGVLT